MNNVNLTDKIKEFQKMGNLQTVRMGVYKFKDNGRNSATINNKAEKYMVVKEILLKKVYGVNNAIEIMLIVPDPESIDVIEKTPEGVA